jgi:hypothetical protein
VIDHARAARLVHLEHLLDLTPNVTLFANLLCDLRNGFAVERFVRTVRSDDRKGVVFESATFQRVLRIVDDFFSRSLVSQALLCFVETTGAKPRW